MTVGKVLRDVFVLFPLPLFEGDREAFYYHQLSFTRMVYFTCGLYLGYLALRQVGLRGIRGWSNKRKRVFVYGGLILLFAFWGSLPMWSF